MKSSFDDLTIKELKNIASVFDIDCNCDKSSLIKELKKKGVKGQLGIKGKDGIIYELKRNRVLKLFKKSKSKRKIKEEAELQELASKYGISPKIRKIDLQQKFIIMDKLDDLILDDLYKKHYLTKKRQHEIIKIFKKLDKIGILHNDPNLANFMTKDGKLFIIDFGMSKLSNEFSNTRLMTLGLILKLRELGFSEKSYSFLKEFLTIEDLQAFQI